MTDIVLGLSRLDLLTARSPNRTSGKPNRWAKMTLRKNYTGS
jgi:hypothetical protein